ncbi:chemotaxis protein CheW, partial [Roseomonas sp. GC11]|uniref:chemotaxis protein CheW n=1 Tax=Roseomonas sp. GC11 TaxID=2950546 RepID=UPI00210E9EFA
MPQRASLPSLAAQAERLIEARTRLLAGRGAAPPVPPLPAVLACRAGGETYGIPLAAVAQVVPEGPCTPLPAAPLAGALPALLGLCAQGGLAYAVIDLGSALGGSALGAAARAPEAGHFLLLREAPRRLALRVDRALAVLHPLPLA